MRSADAEMRSRNARCCRERRMAPPATQFKEEEKKGAKKSLGRRIVGGGPTGAGAGDPGGLMTSIHSVLGAPAPGLPMGALMAERVGPTLSAGIPVWSKR